MFQSEGFFREAWPQISQSVATCADAASDVQWIAGATGLEPGARVLDGTPFSLDSRRLVVVARK